MSAPSAAQVRDAYHYCLGLARRHYENFPVASLAVPARLRGPVAAIYAYARTADDFADEEERTPEARLALLRDYARRLDEMAAGDPGNDPVFIALDDCRQRFRLPLPPSIAKLDRAAGLDHREITGRSLFSVANKRRNLGREDPAPEGERGEPWTVEEDGLVENARVVGEGLLERLVELAGEFPGKVTNIRGKGLFIAFDLPDGATRGRVLSTWLDSESGTSKPPLLIRFGPTSA